MGVQFVVFHYRKADHRRDRFYLILLVPAAVGRDTHAGLRLDCGNVYLQRDPDDAGCRWAAFVFLHIHQTGAGVEI